MGQEHYFFLSLLMCFLANQTSTLESSCYSNKTFPRIQFFAMVTLNSNEWSWWSQHSAGRQQEHIFILILKLSSLAAGAIIDGGQKASWEPLLIVVGRSHQSVLTWNSLTGIWLKRHPVLKLQLLCHQKSPKVNIDWIWCFILAWRRQWCIWYKECRSCVDETLIRLICQKLAEDWSRLSPRQCMLDISHIIWQRRKKSSPMN